MKQLTSLAMTNRLQAYGWGSHSLLASLRGEPASGDPEAELWMGAHRAAPSVVEVDGAMVDLDQAIAGDPTLVGDEPGGQARLPFLLKLLAAGEPLSLQAHPTKERAIEGFARENAAGIALTAAHRSYRDDNHKPELICALTPFRALSGFRDPSTTAVFFDSLECDALVEFSSRLSANPSGATVLEVVEEILRLDASPAAELADAVAVAVGRLGSFQDERDVASRIASIHQGDAGLVIALMLELVTLSPGEAIYLGAGRLHAYIDGLGVEIMASSDNVLRGGLTPKHVDIGELVEVLVPAIEPIDVMTGDGGPDGEVVYCTPAPEFELSRFDLDGSVERSTSGPEVLVVTSGETIEIDGVLTRPTESRFVPAAATWRARGRGQFFRAKVPDHQAI